MKQTNKIAITPSENLESFTEVTESQYGNPLEQNNIQSKPVPKWRCCCSITILAPLLIATSMLILAFSVWGSMFYLSQSMARALTTELGGEISDSISNKLDISFRAIPQVLSQMESYFKLNYVRVDKDDESLKNILKSMYAVSSSHTQDLDGISLIYGSKYKQFGSVGLRNNTRNCRTSYKGYNSTYFKSQACDPLTGMPIGNMTTFFSRYDPTIRPWYIEAVEKKEVIWTDFYVFAGDVTIGFTASIPIINKTNNEVIAIPAVDFTLSNVNGFMKALKVAKTGHSVVLDSNKLMVAATKGDILNTTTGVRYLGNQSFVPEIASACQFVFDLNEDFTSTINQAKNAERGLSFVTDSKMLNIKFFKSTIWKGKSDFIIVTVFPMADFTAELDRTLLISAIVVVFFALFITFVTLGGVMLVIVVPLIRISRKMMEVSDMNLSNIKHGKAIFYEMALIKNAFHLMVDKLKEYRSYIPEELLLQVESQKQKILSRDVETRSKASKRLDTYSNASDVQDEELKSVVSGTSRFSSESKDSAQSRHLLALSTKNILSIGLSPVNCSIIQIRLLNVAELWNQDQMHSYIEHYGLLLNLIREECPSGLISEFIEDRVFITFNVTGRYIRNHQMMALRYVAKLRKKLNEQPFCFTYVIAAHYGPIYSGNLGNKVMRTRRIVGPTKTFTDVLIEQGIRHKVTTVISDHLKSVVKSKNETETCVTRILDILKDKSDGFIKIHELLDVVRVQGNEWLYEIEQQKQINRYSSFNQVMNQILDLSKAHDIQEGLTYAIEDMQNYIEMNDQDDFWAEKIQAVLNKSLDDGVNLFKDFDRKPYESLFKIDN